MNTAREEVNQALEIFTKMVKPTGISHIPVNLDHYIDLLTFYRDNHPSTKLNERENLCL